MRDEAAQDSEVIGHALSAGQKAIWFVCGMHQGCGIYNTHFAWRVPSNLDADRLRSAIETLHVRHPSLRTLIREGAEGVQAQVLSSMTPDFEVVRWEAASEDAINALVDQELQTPFDLGTRPPTRWRLCRLPDGGQLLVVVQHHLLEDLWSFMIQMGQLVELYRDPACVSGPQWAPGDPVYGEHVRQELDYLGSETAAADREYWRQLLSDAPQILNLPVDFPRPAEISVEADVHRIGLSSGLMERMREFCRRHEVRPLAFCAAVLQLLLSRYAGQQTVLLALPIASRGKEFTEQLGYFINTLVLRGDLDADPAFASHLQATHAQFEESLRHARLPFASVSSDLLRERNPGYASLVQVALVWEDLNRFGDQVSVDVDEQGQESWDMGAMGKWSRFNRVQQTDEFDLTFKLSRFPSGAGFAIEYKRGLFDPETIRRTAGHFVHLLEAAMTTPESPVSELPCLSTEERETLLHGWNRTAQSIPDPWFHEHVGNIAAQYPDHIALHFEGRELSYRELDLQANRLAHALRERGIDRGQTVGIALPRCAEMMVCVLAVFRAGGAYVPLDPDYPRERILMMVEDAELALVLAGEACFAVFDGLPVERILADDLEPLTEGMSSTPPDVRLVAEDSAYIYFTSGSTGRPKGVVVNHGNLRNLAVTQQGIFDLQPDQRVLMFASLNFDFSVFAYVLAWRQGCALYVAPKETLLGESLQRYLRLQRINWVLLPPSVAARLDTDLPDLHTLGVGGEACTPDVTAKWHAQTRLANIYGPTEATVWATWHEIRAPGIPPIGRPVANTRAYVLDTGLQPVPVGVAGELFLAGVCVADGYRDRPEQTAERFLPDPFHPGERMYRTGDLVRWNRAGEIEFLGRLDHQVKIRGHRIELGDVESVILSHASIEQVVVLARPNRNGEQQMIAYIVGVADTTLTPVALKQWLRAHLPEHMIPAHIVVMDAFPLTPNDKIDRKLLPDPSAESDESRPVVQPWGPTESVIAEIWQDLLGLDDVSVDENFFDLGGHSLLLAEVHARLPDSLRRQVQLVDLFRYPTIRGLATYLGKTEEENIFVKPDDHLQRVRAIRDMVKSVMSTSIAIVGMAGRFPQAHNVEEFWHNLCEGRDCISQFSAEELIDAGLDPELVNHPNYVRAKGYLRGISGFDADFFHFTPREAQLTDPQQRLFLESCWEALEDAGCVPSKFGGGIGVFAGIGLNNYMMTNIATNPELVAMVGEYPIMIGNDKDFLSTRVSYKLDLNGPAMVLQSACSTSLLVIHAAARALLAQECRMALAGAVSLGALGRGGYVYQEGMITSPNGECRAFDAAARGTLQGQGVGVIALKRLDDAIADNDQIYAVIKGTAINNDGSNKVGYTAPSAEGQTRVIRTALVAADVEPDTISFVETHGTGTVLGDPIEIRALTDAFRARTTRRQFCAIASTKPNIGHTDVAAGMAGVIKTAMAMRHRKLPPSIHFEKPNPKIDFEATPFYVNTQLREWLPPDAETPLRAGVSAFGIGGTNAHVILEEAPQRPASERARPWELICLAARSPITLEHMTSNLANHIETHPEQNISDVAYTLHTGRTHFPQRRFMVCEGATDAALTLRARDPARVFDHLHEASDPPRLVFMFPGQGSQYVDMARHLYKVEVGFRETVDECRELLRQRFVYLFERLSEADIKGRTERLHDTSMTQPALFIVEYALAKLLMGWGVKPNAMIGHSVGEYVAATLAGVFTLEQALELVAMRGQLISELPRGDMLSVRLGETALREQLGNDLDLAAVNGPESCVASGSSDAVRALHERLSEQGVDNHILHTSHAFHSRMLDPMLDLFRQIVARRTPQAPTQRFVSNVTGDWISDAQACDPDYWVRHLRSTVRFHDGIGTVLGEAERDNRETILLEVGPGRTLCTLARRNPARRPGDLVLETMRRPQETESDTHRLLSTMGRLWQHGVEFDWERFHITRQCYRVALPAYPFDRQRYWIEPRKPAQLQPADASVATTDTVSAAKRVREAAAGVVPGAPDAATEKMLALWRGLLGIQSIGEDDDFFDLGGDSLLAVRLVARVKEEFDVPLASHTLLQHPTIRRLLVQVEKMGARHVAGAEGEPSALIEIQAGETGRAPLVLVHPIGGEVYFYRDLAHYLGSAQPVYAFQAPSLAGRRAPYSDISRMAADYLADLRGLVENVSGCVIGGASFGGYVAWEMAQALRNEGWELPPVVMIDTPGPASLPPELTDSAAVIEYLLQGRIPLSPEDLRGLSTRDQVEYVFEQARALNREDELPPHLGISLLETWMSHQQAMRAFQPRAYPGDVLYFQHTEPMAHFRGFPANPHEDWQALVRGELTVHRVPGNHISMNLRPHVRHIAEHLAGILAATLETA